MTISPETLKRIIFDQKEEITLTPQEYITRSMQSKLAEMQQNREVIVLTGVRRAGKSILLQYIRNKNGESDYYFNFEDERLVNFTSDDFQLLQEIFIEAFGVQKNFYFDEIQNIHGWEMFVRRLYNNGNKIYLTGSNANLFSEELGTRLTGRYIALTIFPISFAEYVFYKNKTLINNSFLTTLQHGLLRKLYAEYAQLGGIPEYLKHQQKEYLHSLYESIIYRDIIARYRITNSENIKKLMFFLASNCGKEITFSSLQKMLGIGSATTVSDYCSHIANSFLCFFLNRYHDSLKTQQQSPKKVYFIDHVLAKTLGFRASEDYGRLLENIVFLELKRKNYSLYYHKETKECDFIVRENEKTTQVIQVCTELSNLETKQREIAGLIEAMNRFSLSTGLIISDNENYSEKIFVNNKHYQIEVKSIWLWLLQ